MAASKAKPPTSEAATFKRVDVPEPERVRLAGTRAERED
jgi:hypothetical protein